MLVVNFWTKTDIYIKYKIRTRLLSVNISFGTYYTEICEVGCEHESRNVWLVLSSITHNRRKVGMYACLLLASE